MFACITSYPSLGRWTIVPATQSSVAFAVLLESITPSVADWEVEIWWGVAESSSWKGLRLHHSERLARRLLSNLDTSGATHHHWYEGSLQCPPQNIQFTIRFRTSTSADWKWTRDLSGLEDGRLLLQHVGPYHDHVTDYIDDFDHTHIRASKQLSDAPDTALWVATAGVSPARGDDSGWSKYRIGSVRRSQRWFAIVRLDTPWLAPRHGKFTHQLATEDALLYSFLRSDGLHVVMLAVSGIGNVQTTLRRDGNVLALEARNEDESKGTAYMISTVSRKFDSALSAAMYKARSLVSSYSLASPLDASLLQPKHQTSDTVRTNWVQDWYDGFAYCTWNGLGKDLTADKIDHALRSLQAHGIDVTNLIIDDNWQSLDRESEKNSVQGWKDFEANPKAFPHGLSAAIRGLRATHPGLQHVAVWHALLGYWAGISSEGRLARAYRTRRVKVRDEAAITTGSMLVIDPADVSKMYKEFYDFLQSCTIDSVKTDVQFALDELTSANDRRQMMSSYRNAWTIAHLSHFTGHAISCMSQTPFMLFTSLLPNNLPTIPARNSNDFFPDVEESHPWHIFCNAHNSLLTKHLNVLPDWDMFQSSHPWASFHAAARCLSGGPICITDEPGKHDLNLIRQITAQTSKEQTVILRPSVVGRSGEAYVAYEEDALLKLDAYNGPAKAGASFSGFFNCRPSKISHIVHLCDFMGLDDDVEYIIRAYRSGLVSKVLTKKQPHAVAAVEVASHSWEILTATPVTTLELPRDNGDTVTVRISPIGLITHMVGAVGMVSSEIVATPVSGLDQSHRHEAAHKARITITLKALGILGIWVHACSESRTMDTSQSDMLVLLEEQVIPEELVTVSRCSLDSTSAPAMVCIDVLTAWKRLGLKGTVSNEVTLDTFISYA